VIEALPTDIPDGMEYDVSEMQINDTVNVESLQPPEGVTIVTEPDTVLVMVSPPRLAVEEEPGIEEETELVADGETGEEAEEQARESSEESGGEGEE
jgi:large subunit ribosomal protein L25